jgi:hypothetical protein
VSNFTNHAENKIADCFRGQGLAGLPTNWFVALASAADDGSFTELSGTGYARFSVARSLANFAGTQGAGTTLASSGTSHATSNNTAWSYGTSGSAWGTATHIGFFDAGSAGNCWMWLPLAVAIPIAASGVAVSIAIGAVAVTLGLTGGMSDYCANKLIDLIFRGQAFTWPATLYGALFTVAPSNAGGGTEVSVGSYARFVLASTLAALSGTQAAGSTVASTGTSGRISNNAALSYPAPSAAQGTVVAEGLIDASTGGNLMFWAALSSPRTISSGSPAQTHPADSLSITVA